jgi:hypothetical protein
MPPERALAALTDRNPGAGRSAPGILLTDYPSIKRMLFVPAGLESSTRLLLHVHLVHEMRRGVDYQPGGRGQLPWHTTTFCNHTFCGA